MVIDRFDDASAWQLILADGVKGQIVEENGALRLDYDFTAGAGYCVVRRAVDLPLDPNYRFTYRFKGTGPRNTLEFKLIDPTDENVWWSVARDIRFPDHWSDQSIRRRHVSFAWGPSGGAALERARAVEFAVTASRGGKGSIWLDDLAYERLPDIEPTPTEPRASSGSDDLGRVGADGSVRWSARTGSALVLAFDHAVEFGAIELEWERIAPASQYHIEVASGTSSFVHLATVTGSDGGADLVFAPETEARSVRITVSEGTGELGAIRFLPVAEIVTPNDYISMLAARSPRGSFPKSFSELSAWTVIGLPGSENEALVSDTGAIEPVKGGGTLEPFLIRDGRVQSWADATITHSLEDGSLPIPSVRWAVDGLDLDITALVTDDAMRERTLARYRITNTGRHRDSFQLALAGRPFQALPAAQFLNIVGGATRTHSVEVDAQSIRFMDRAFATAHTDADRVIASDVASGLLVDRLAASVEGPAAHARRDAPFASGALIYPMTLEPGESRSVVVSLPMIESLSGSPAQFSDTAFETVLQRERARWQEALSRTRIMVPDGASRLRHAVRANLAYILINADGPRIQPGSRTYERSWIRDGAMTSAALLALGHDAEARDFIEWYAPYQYEHGKIPCVVDARGADPVDENDAPGQFIFAIRNSAEAGGRFDESFARAMYPRVRSAVAYIESMRNLRLTDEYAASDDPILRACAGLMPESISHEGYSEKPMHSHWDNFWVYRGLLDAAVLAGRLGETEDRERFETLAEAFGDSIRTSINATASIHGIDYVPGCVELGDFDATSTSIAFYPTRASEVVNAELLANTFERAWQATAARIDGGDWDGMTPYEVRTVGTFVRLGWIDRAHAYLGWLFERQDPAGWAQWGEIAYKDRTPSRFVGDMPHTWVGSGAILSLFAYEESDAMVLAAGIPADWFTTGQSVGVENQQTRFGALSYSIETIDGSIELLLWGTCMPPAGFKIDAARLAHASGVTLSGNTPHVTADGAACGVGPDGYVVVPAQTQRVLIRE